jgi:hypothetical protein
MDERTPPTPASTASSDSELAATAAPSSAQPDHQPVTDADSTVVYCSDAESVREGFWLALSLMQASSNLLPPDAAPPAGNLQEDN